MYLSCVKLWNFRKFGKDGEEIDLAKPHLSVPFTQGVNLLVGENDAGKTAVVDALKLVLKTHSVDWVKIEAEDFHLNTTRLRIECIFDDIRDDEAVHFLEWLGMKESVDARGHKIVTSFLKVIVDVGKVDNRVLSYEVRAGADDEGRILSYEAREFLKATYLKPLRDAKAELIARKNSRLSQILHSHPVFKDKDSHELVTILADANSEIRKYFEDETAKGSNGFEILETLKAYLKRFLKKNSTQDTKLHIDDPKLKNILELLKLTLEDEHCGLGTYNLLFIATELLHLKKDNYNGLRLGLIEEMEAHLHPQAQLRVMSALEADSKTDATQLLLTTHSPNLTSKVPIKNLIMFFGSSAYSLAEEFTLLEPDDYNFLERFLDVTKANLFFAQGVIFVEGDSESLLMPVLAKLVGKDLTEHGVSVINCGGVTFLRYSRIFQRKIAEESLKIPISVITDLDVLPVNETTEKQPAIAAKNIKYSGQSVQSFISPHWTLEYCIALSDNFRETLFDAIKSAGEEMTRDGYTGKKIPETWSDFTNGLNREEIAEKVHSLVSSKGKKISKVITAQYFAKSLEAKTGDVEFVSKIKEDKHIKYLIDAIEYATSYN